LYFSLKRREQLWGWPNLALIGYLGGGGGGFSGGEHIWGLGNEKATFFSHSRQGGGFPESRASPEDLASRGVVQESDPLLLKEPRVCMYVFGATVPSGPGPPHSRGF
jgi:hypothetical protein